MNEFTDLTPEGRKALVRVAEWLEAGAPHLVLGSGLQLSRFDMGEPVTVYEQCSTSCCIAGAVCQFEQLGGRDGAGDLHWTGEDGARTLAAELLGLNDEDASKLFEPWSEWSENSSEFSYAARGAAVIRHLLATGEVDWGRFDEEGAVWED